MNRNRPTRLVRVTAPGSSGDFALSADSSFADLAPLLAGLLGLGQRPDVWNVAVDGQVLEPAATPAEAGVIDGDRLELTARARPCVRLVDRRPPEPDRPRSRRFGSAAC